MELILKGTMYTIIGLFVLKFLPIVIMAIVWLGYATGELIKKLFKN